MIDTEKAALERRIDELCAEVERLHADQAHWELGNCPSCPNIADLQEALEQNAKLRELCKRVLKNCYDAYEQVWGWDDDWVILCDEARELGVTV